MDCKVHRVAKSWTLLSDFHFASLEVSSSHTRVCGWPGSDSGEQPVAGWQQGWMSTLLKPRLPSQPPSHGHHARGPGGHPGGGETPLSTAQPHIYLFFLQQHPLLELLWAKTEEML